MAPRRIYVRMGDRGFGLALIGVLWMIRGVGLWVSPPAEFGYPDDGWPVWARAAMWLASGAFAIGCASTRMARKFTVDHSRVDPNGWAALQVPVALTGALSLWAWVIGAVPSAWLRVLSFATTGTFIYICAKGLNRPAPVPKPRLPRGSTQ